MTALSRSYRECLRRSLGFFFFFFPPTVLFFSTSRRPAWRFWQFSPGGGFPWLLAFLVFAGAFLPLAFLLPPPPAACSARPAGVALSQPPPKSTNGRTVTPDVSAKPPVAAG